MSKVDRRAFIAAAVAASVGIGSGLVFGRHWGRGPSGDTRAIDLGLAAATAGAVGIGTGLLVGRRTKGPAEGQSIDIVIIGAGVAGTLAAHRLAARYPTKSIAVFESRSRIGGRLWSVPMPPVENELAELGGMRTPFQHRATLDLIEELGLTTHPAPASAPSNFVRLRGTRMRRRDVTHAGQFPYQMRGDLAALPPDSFFTLLAESVGLHDLSKVGGDETGDWLDGLRHHGTKLSFITAGELLEAEFGAEGAAFVQDWIGYELADLSASKWLGTVLAVSDADYLGLNGGMQRIPLTLAERASEAGVDIHPGWQAISITDDPESAGGLTVHFGIKTESGTRTVRAGTVILAQSGSSMRRLWFNSPILQQSAVLSRALGHLIENDSIKIYLAYDRPWWRDLGLEPGRSVSDGPLRQTIYLQEDPSGASLIMASYSFGRHAFHTFPSLESSPTEQAAGKLDDAVIREVTDALSELHGITVPLPIDGRGVRWGDTTIGSDIPLWGPGVEPWKMTRELIAPLDRRRLFVCGDALSLNQGWVLGALQTTAHVLDLI